MSVWLTDGQPASSKACETDDWTAATAAAMMVTSMGREMGISMTRTMGQKLEHRNELILWEQR